MKSLLLTGRSSSPGRSDAADYGLPAPSSAAPPVGSAAAPALEPEAGVDVGVGVDLGGLEVEVPRFTGSSLAVVCVYCVLFAVAATGNLTVFVTLVRGRRYRKSRISLMIAHLAAADLVVTFIMMPLEVGWRLTTQWVAGDAACKVFLLLRAFGLYLSSNVLVCVSLDRYFAVLHPLKVNDARRRGKVMLALAWLIAFVCSVPQSVVFHTQQHPKDPNFVQCVTFGFFTSQLQETAYNLFCVVAMYFVPLLVICVAYSCILSEITSKSRDNRKSCSESSCATATPPALEAAPRSASCSTLPRAAAAAVGAAPSPLRRPLSQAPLQPQAGNATRMRLRRSDASCIERARARTLRMTITIVAAFIWCWTPYVVMTLWYMFDRQSAERVDQRLQDALFIMAVSNSCVNPLVYGSYAMRSCPLLHRRRDRERAAVARPLLLATRPPPRRRHVGALPPTAISWRATADAASRTSSSASSSHQRPATR